MRRHGRLALAAIAAWLLVAAPAHAATATSVVMFSDPGDYLGAGQQRVFTPSNAQITVTGGAGKLDVGVTTSGTSYRLHFEPSPGGALAPGVYDHAENAWGVRSPGRPGMAVDGGGRACNQITGRFEVRDIATDGAGAIQRLWIVYEQHCEGAAPATFGEVRVREPLPAGPLTASPGIVRWPPSEPQHAGTAVPVTVEASAATNVTGVAVSGGQAGDFPIRNDGCSGQVLAPGGSCQVWVAFTPTAPGTRLATLAVSDGSGGRREVALQAWSYGGTSSLTMHSDSGDSVGEGRDWSYGASDAISAIGGRDHVGFDVKGADGNSWSGDFAPGQGAALAPGTFSGAQNYPGNSTGPQIHIMGWPRECTKSAGSFAVEEATFDANGAVRTFAVSFEQHCEGSAAALRGSFQFRACDAAAPAPWMAADTGPVAPCEPRAAATPDPARDGAPSSVGPTAAPSPLAALRAGAARLTRDLRRWERALRRAGRARVRAAARRVRADVASARRDLLALGAPSAGARRYARGLARLERAARQHERRTALRLIRHAGRDLRAGARLLGL